MHDQNWDDLRFVLLLSRSGSMIATAADLNVDRTTVLRRIAAIEARLGFRLFHKSGSKYAPLAEARPVIAAAERIESALVEAGRLMSNAGEGLDGAIAVTTTDSLYLSGVSEIIADFMARYPALQVNLFITTRHLNLDRLEAEVSIRPTANPPDTLVGRRAASVNFGVFGAHDYLARYDGDEIADHLWLGFGESISQSPPAKWLDKKVPSARLRLKADTFIALAEACRLGAGLAILPRSYARRLPELVRVEKFEKDTPELGLWVLTHEDFKNLPRVRLFTEFVAREIHRRRHMFEN